MIHVEEEIELLNDISISDLASDLLEETRKFVNCKYECDLEILIVDETGIQNINKYTRGIDKPTDVLSFPYIEFDKPAVFPVESELDFEPDSGELLLGQVVVCAPICIKQSQDYGHSVMRELAFLITHSLLHLFGYDHMVKSEEEVMFKAQETILNNLGYTR